MSGSGRVERGRAGLTLIELMLALGLASIVFAALLGLLDTALGLFERTERSRDLAEIASVAGGLVERDLAALTSDPRGDLVADWILLDADADGIAGLPVQRLRFVRHATPAELARLQVRRPAPLDGQGLVEVAWALLPVGGGARPASERTEGVLQRGVRIVGDPDLASFLGDGFFGANGKAAPGSLEDVTGGVLWFEVACATPSTVLRGGWELGSGFEQAPRSWDAWGRGRPDSDAHGWNERGEGVPQAGVRPVLPRRARIVLELERSEDRKRRTELDRTVDERETSLRVRDPSRLPEAGGFLLLDEEWMEVHSVSGRTVSVSRGVRGTRARQHGVGAMVHYGERFERAVPLAAARGGWGS